MRPLLFTEPIRERLEDADSVAGRSAVRAVGDSVKNTLHPVGGLFVLAFQEMMQTLCRISFGFRIRQSHCPPLLSRKTNQLAPSFALIIPNPKRSPTWNHSHKTHPPNPPTFPCSFWGMAQGTSLTPVSQQGGPYGRITEEMTARAIEGQKTSELDLPPFVFSKTGRSRGGSKLEAHP